MGEYFARPIFTFEDAQAFIRLIDVWWEDPVSRGLLTGDQAHRIMHWHEYFQIRISRYVVKNDLPLDQLRSILAGNRHNEVVEKLVEEESAYEEWERERKAREHDSLVPHELRQPTEAKTIEQRQAEVEAYLAEHGPYLEDQS
jgi:hypothetical protein